jgi:CheY-like chemotaxis protein
VDSAASAEERRWTSSCGTFSLILTDLNMPGMGGREFYDAL